MPAITNTARPRAIPYNPRKTKVSTSAGPRSFWRKKNASTSAIATRTGRTSFDRGMPKRDSSRRNSMRRAKNAASARITSSRIASTGCTPSRFTFTPLEPGPLPKTSSSAASASAIESGSATVRRNGEASRSIDAAPTSVATPAAAPHANRRASSPSCTGSASAIIVISPMPLSNRTAGSRTGSSVAPRQRRKRCAPQNAAKNTPIGARSPPLNSGDVRAAIVKATPAAMTIVAAANPRSSNMAARVARSCVEIADGAGVMTRIAMLNALPPRS